MGRIESACPTAIQSGAECHSELNEESTPFWRFARPRDSDASETFAKPSPLMSKGELKGV